MLKLKIIIPLLLITSNKKIMGPFANTKVINIIGIIISSIIIILNFILLYMTLFA
jgi:manganese transport protein